MAITPVDIGIIHYHTSGTWPSPLDYRLETPVGFGFSLEVWLKAAPAVFPFTHVLGEAVILSQIITDV